MIQLRPYQQQLIDNIYQSFKNTVKHLMIQAATGAGKTICFTHISKMVSDKCNKVLIMTDRAELLYQAGSSLKKQDLQAFYIQSGCKVVSDTFSCYVAMSQTLRRRIDKEYWINFIKSIDLFIVDEAHKQEFNYLFESGLLEGKHVLGFTATPKRSGKMRQLALDYEEIIESVDIQTLINDGYLVTDDYYGIAPPDLSGIALDYMKGDYQEKAMFQQFDSPTLYAGCVKNYTEICPDSKALVFCVNIQHAIKTTIEFRKNGIKAFFLTSNVSKPKMPSDISDAGKMAAYNERMIVYELYQQYFKELSGNRDEIINGFKNNDFPVLVNASILTTGFDVPDIETIIVNRATLSLTLWLQMLGRGSRPAENKTSFNILDFGGNAERLGHYSEPRLWSLWHETFDGDGLPPMKECGFDSDGKPITDKKGCRRLILASYKICPFCGFKYPEKQHQEVDLDALMYDVQNKKTVKLKRVKEMNYDELYAYYMMKNHKTPWLWRQLWYKGREKSIEQFGNQFDWSKKTIETAIKFCINL